VKPKSILILRLTGKSCQVFLYLKCIAHAYGHITLGELGK
jgi:hypothetical protein